MLHSTQIAIIKLILLHFSIFRVYLEPCYAPQKKHKQFTLRGGVRTGEFNICRVDYSQN